MDNPAQDHHKMQIEVLFDKYKYGTYRWVLILFWWGSLHIIMKNSYIFINLWNKLF